MKDKLQSLIDTFFCSVDIDKFYSQNQKEKLADWLRENGVIVPTYDIGSKVYAVFNSLSLPIPRAVYECKIQRYVLTANKLVAVVKLKKGTVTYSDIQIDISELCSTKEDAGQILKGGEQQ